MGLFGIKENYNHRESYAYFDDMNNTDDWQKEVYKVARDLFEERGYKTVADIGCGSAYKLIKYFGNKNIVGYDVEPTLSKLKEKYPDYTWWLSDFDSQPPDPEDLVICSDVIEHVEDPDALLNYLKRFKAKHYVISTPDRDLVIRNFGGDGDGPPNNPTHIREWNYDEFNDYISNHFEIEKHWISNQGQATQTVICR